MLASSPHTLGIAYRIDPIGAALSGPVEVSLSMEESALIGAHPSMIGIAERHGGGEWLGLLGTSAVLEVPDAGTRVSAFRSGRAVSRRTLTLGDESIEFVLMAFWRVLPEWPIVLNPGASTNIVVEACLEEREVGGGLRAAAPGTAVLASADEDELPPLPPRLQCQPSIRE